MFKGSHQADKDDSSRSLGHSLPGKAFWSLEVSKRQSLEGQKFLEKREVMVSLEDPIGPNLKEFLE